MCIVQPRLNFRYLLLDHVNPNRFARHRTGDLPDQAGGSATQGRVPGNGPVLDAVAGSGFPVLAADVTAGRKKVRRQDLHRRGVQGDRGILGQVGQNWTFSSGGSWIRTHDLLTFEREAISHL